MGKELITKFLFVGNRAEDYFINNKEKLSNIINDMVSANNDKYELNIFQDTISIREIEVQHILVIDSDDCLLEDKIKLFKDLNIFIVIDTGMDKLNIIERYFSNESIIKISELNESLDWLILGVSNICKPILALGDMSYEKSNKELLGYRKYQYKRIDKVASSIKELESDIMEVTKLEQSKTIVLIVFFHYQKFLDIQCEVSDLEYELGNDKEFICFKVGHDNIDNQDNIQLLLMWS